ncbi:MAG: hypothetical protein KGK08_08975 [Acidobacteriota bacterium]|nr:hypothetical protein [Acidobacteriota bacterium]
MRTSVTKCGITIAVAMCLMGRAGAQSAPAAEDKAVPAAAVQRGAPTGKSDAAPGTPVAGAQVATGQNAQAKSVPDASATPPLSPEELQLAADVKRLYELAADLRQEVAKTNKDTLSLSVIHKSEEVEKLAKSIKERMHQQERSALASH